MKRVHYLRPDKSEVVIYNPKDIDHPITVQVVGVKCTYNREENEARGRPPRGAYYFRKIKLGETLNLAEKVLQAEINERVKDGSIPIPTSKKEQRQLDNFVTRKIISEAPKRAKEFSHLIVVDTW